MIKGISFVLGLSMVCGAVACSGEVGSVESATDGTAGSSGSVDPSSSDLLSWRKRRSATGGTTVNLGTGGTVASTGGTVASTGGTVASTGGTVASTGGTKATGGTGGTTLAGSGGSTAVACPAAAPATATIYYACDCAAGADKDCVAGNDSNVGTSASSPWRSFERARQQFASLRPGDRIEFCKGGRFAAVAGGSQWVNPTCTAANPCVVASYKAPWASGDEGRPFIHSPTGQNAIDMADSGNADHEEGYVFAGLELEGEKTGVGYFVYNDIDNVTICDSSIHDFGIGVQSAGANATNPGADAINANLMLTDSAISNNGDQGFLGGELNATIQNTSFKNNGFNRVTFNHNIYIATEDGNGNNIVIRNNDLYQSAIVNGRCEGTSLVAHGLLNNLLIVGNKVHEDPGIADLGCWGIAVVPGYSIGESFQNIVIRGNTVTNVGNESIGVASCQKCTIEDNVVVNQQGFNDTAIAAPGGSEDSIDAKTDQITVRNNSILIDVGVGVGVLQEGSGHVVSNNAIYNTATQTNHLACFNLNLPTTAYNEVDHNDCYSNGKGEWNLGQGALATWVSKSGFDGHSTTANPAFKSVASPYDLSISSSSPLVNTGDTNCATVDILGKTRVSPSDIGAFEL